jgi:Ca2+-binding RTX toxin-like protein
MTAISADLGSGNDSITLSRTTNPVPADISSSLLGGAGDDTLNGGDGSDMMTGGGGASDLGQGCCDDAFNGFGGADTVSYADHDSTRPVVVDIGGGANDGHGPLTVGGDPEGDNVGADIENILGGGGADQLTGDGGPNQLSGGPGDADRLTGGGGPDSLSGGAGVGDRALYVARTAAEPVVADIGGGANDGGSVDGPAASRDDIQGDVEGIHGGAGDDVLTGSGEANVLAGLGGNDQLFALGGDDGYREWTFDCGFTATGSYLSCTRRGLYGGEGDDLMVGGTGQDLFLGFTGADTVSYAERTSAVTVDIGPASGPGVANDGDSTANGGEGEDDLVQGDIENLVGGSGPDALTGSAAGNVLTGGDGGDRLFAFGGGDMLFGENGGDTLNGGAEVDDFEAGAGVDELQAFDGNAEPVDCGADTDSYIADGTDTLTDCETNLTDTDLDGVPDVSDNCAAVSNPNQENNDDDANGDACDGDDDNDGDLDDADNCPLDANADQLDTDSDTEGDACDADDDNDALDDPMDACPVLDGVGSDSGCLRRSRTLTLGYSPKRKRFKGRLTSAEPQCIGGQAVTIFKQREGDDLEIGEATTGASGGYKLKRRAKRGIYYSTVERSVVTGVAECDPATSPLFRVARR